jgi:peptide chain release factor 2
VTRPDGVLEDVAVLVELGEEAEDESVCEEAESLLDSVDVMLAELELARMLGGPQDPNNAIVHINAGAGGTESLDWAGMLYRMYLRYCDKKDWSVRILDENEGDEAGVKSVTFTATGDFAYGMLKAESGIHRLVRISPFDAGARRHTTFASVFVYPEVDENIDIQINENDLKIDTYRAGGAGGQHVNKTDSAVRITHEPSGIVVQCQNERSQQKNKSTAMKVLKSRLYDMERKKRDDAAEALHATKKDISFGSQIRSYVLHPYRLVKDHRTNHENGNADAVLDGELDPFIEAYLMSD